MTEHELLDQFGNKILAGVNKNHPVVGLSWKVSYVPNLVYYQFANTNPQPGFSGRVWIRYCNPIKRFGSDGFRGTKTYTGTGGFGGYSGPWEAISTRKYQAGVRKLDRQYPEVQCYSWDYKFSLLEHPELGEIATIASMEDCASELLGSSARYSLHHRFVYENPVTVQRDQEFIQYVESTLTEQDYKILAREY